MKVLHTRNVQHALPLALDALRAEGVRRDSRNGPVILFEEPVTTVYYAPAERIIYWPERDANPFFHFVESLWMLGGRNDVETVARYVGRMRTFSDDGVTFHGAYGHRWRHHFDRDQLPVIIEALRANPDDRRQVLSMWDARADLGRQGKDLPCNLQAIFQINTRGALDMTVTNRSNDIIWGAYGANAVHFSFLQEFMASAIGVPVGKYRQVSANLHAYVDVLEKVQGLADAVPEPGTAPTGVDPWADRDPYAAGLVKPFPIMTGTDYTTWLADLDMFLTNPHAVGFTDPFWRRVAGPILRAHELYQQKEDAGRYSAALAALEDCKATDWKLACQQWILRRLQVAEAKARAARAQDDGVAYE